MKTLTLLHLYPNEMNLYGDRGNVLALFRQLHLRNIELKVVHASLGAWQSTYNDADIIFGNVVLESTLTGPAKTLVGFENHSGLTTLGQGVQPLGKVLIGKGNNGQDQQEGAVQGTLMGTYLHGSLLPKNEWLSVHLLNQAWQRQHGEPLPALIEPLPQVEESFAKKAHQEALLVAKSKENR